MITSPYYSEVCVCYFKFDERACGLTSSLWCHLYRVCLGTGNKCLKDKLEAAELMTSDPEGGINVEKLSGFKRSAVRIGMVLPDAIRRK